MKHLGVYSRAMPVIVVVAIVLAGGSGIAGIVMTAVGHPGHKSLSTVVIAVVGLTIAVPTLLSIRRTTQRLQASDVTSAFAVRHYMLRTILSVALGIAAVARVV